MDAIAETYVKLVLALGVHDPDEVDSYFGPPEWRKEAEAARLPLDEIERRAEEARGALGPAPGGESIDALRHRALAAQLAALRARAAIVGGRFIPFEEEAKAIYGVVPPRPAEPELLRTIDAIDRALPGDGPIAARVEEFRSQFHVPLNRLRATVEAAIAQCRTRTLRRIALPAGESFSLELVSGKPWAGYNRYKGGFRSEIQVNTDLPLGVDRVLDVGCHEGYPGHHVFYSLQDEKLARERGWVEFTVNALFSASSLVAEGTASHGIDLAFPGAERADFERRVLWPAAGLDPGDAERYYAIQKLDKELRYARNEAARRLLDGEIDAAGAAGWLERYALMTPQHAAQSVRFIRRYRSYVLNYNLGEDLVRAWVERVGGADREDRWRAFERLLVTPRTPADLSLDTRPAAPAP